MNTSKNHIILDENYYNSLVNNRVIMIENFMVGPEIINLLEEKNIAKGDNLIRLRESKSNAEKIDCIIQSLQMRKSSFFNEFCDILMMSGHPMVAEILNKTAIPEMDLDLGEIWNEIPNLKRSLIQTDKEKLLKFINRKIKEETIKSMLNTSKEDQRKGSLTRLNQIQKNWKYQKEIKGKEKETDQLKDKLFTVEDQLVEKQKQLKLLTTEYNNQKQKQEAEMAIATKFNTANDKEIKRKEDSLSLFRTVISKTSLKIRESLRSFSTNYDKLIRESSDSNVRKYDTAKQLEIYEKLIENFIEIFNNLLLEMKEYEKLKVEVKQIIQLINPEKVVEKAENLTMSFKNFEMSIITKINFLQRQLKLQDNFIFGLLEQEDVPEKFRNIQVPSSERNKLMNIIMELEKINKSQEALLASKEKDYKRLIQSRVQSDNNSNLNNIPEEQKPNFVMSDRTPKEYYSSTTAFMPFSFSSRCTKKEPRGNPNIKPKKTHFLKTSIVNFS